MVLVQVRSQETYAGWGWGNGSIKCVRDKKWGEQRWGKKSLECVCGKDLSVWICSTPLHESVSLTTCVSLNGHSVLHQQAAVLSWLPSSGHLSLSLSSDRSVGAMADTLPLLTPCLLWKNRRCLLVLLTARTPIHLRVSLQRCLHKFS